MSLLILTYAAGVLTILSPCILPVLPFVFSRAQGSFWKTGVPLLIGMALTFSLLSGLAITGGEWIAKANEAGRVLAMGLMALFGLSLVVPRLSEAAFAPLARFGSRLGQNARHESFGGSVLIGASTGLLWAPCAGPILGLVLTGAATQGNVGSSVGLLLAYSLGAATSLAMALVAGNRFFKTLKRFLGVDQVIKKGLGIAVLLGVVAIAFNLDRTVLTKLSTVSTNSLEQRLLSWSGLKDKKELSTSPTTLPELDGIVAWLNSPPLSKESLRGKVVLIDFWTYSCINCLRTLPYLKAWHERYKENGLVIVGVHTPEFAFEKDVNNVKKAVTDLGLTYPIAVDSQYKVWNAFQNEYWPAHYFIDRQGRVRFQHFGEGEYEASEKWIRQLLAEDGRTIEAKATPLVMNGLALEGSDRGLSPETYVGFERAENFVANRDLVPDQVADYKTPAVLKPNQWSMKGSWKVESERAWLAGTTGSIVYRFRGRDLNLVLGGDGISFRVKINGQAPAKGHGLDVDESGYGRIQGNRLYQLIRLEGEEAKGDHLFEIEFLKGGAEVYAFTFG